MLCIMALERNGVTPDQGEVLVTGANGGVGSFAIALLSKLGYRVVASTGRLSEHEYLKQLGASEIIDRATLSEPGKPLAKERWAAVIDSVGVTPWPTPVPVPAPKAPSPLVGWPRAWTFRLPSRPLSCAA